MKNKWEIAFWICLLLLITTTIIGIYSIFDQAVTITYMQEGYSDTEADLETMIQIIGQPDQTKQGIQQILKNHRLYEFMDFNTDTIELERVILIFKNNSLKYIEKQW